LQLVPEVLVVLGLPVVAVPAVVQAVPVVVVAAVDLLLLPLLLA